MSSHSADSTPGIMQELERREQLGLTHLSLIMPHPDDIHVDVRQVRARATQSAGIRLRGGIRMMEAKLEEARLPLPEWFLEPIKPEEFA